MKKYTFKLQHDKGFFYISVVESSLREAINTVTGVENCPESAVKNIKVTPLKKDCGYWIKRE